MSGSSLSRRHFLRLGAGSVVIVGLGACSDGASSGRTTGTTTRSAAGTSPGTTAGGTLPTATSTTTTLGAAGGGGRGRGRLVVVQLNGGNDGLNTVVPLDGRYHDARPTIGLADADLVSLAGVTDVGLHPGLAPLVPLWEAKRLTVVRGIGFPDPNRSHFVSLDRWWRADQPSSPGWLGRVLDALPEEQPLYATALNGGAPLLGGATRQPTVVTRAADFRFSGIDPALVRALGGADEDPLRAAARGALARAVDAVADFAEVTAKAADDGSDPADREGGATIAGGLAIAAELLLGDVGTSIVVVSAGGFDTHANQVPTQQNLLADLADGVATFFATLDAAGADDVLLVTTSEFGRRVAENGNAGTDHGAGNVSFMAGAGLVGGVAGAIDLGDLLDGDVRPTIDPRTMYTACLDWIGADPVAVLGQRSDQVPLLT